MIERLFYVRVHYISDLDLEAHTDSITIVAKDDMKARARAIELALLRDKNESRQEIKKVLFCEIEYAGTLDGHAKA
jgi:hypothetical protein